LRSISRFKARMSIRQRILRLPEQYDLEFREITRAYSAKPPSPIRLNRTDASSAAANRINRLWVIRPAKHGGAWKSPTAWPDRSENRSSSFQP
jgi:hypothetical protein